MAAADTGQALDARTFTLQPDAAHHVGVADQLISLRLGQLARLADTVSRLWPQSQNALAEFLARLTELGSTERAALADDPFFHAPFTALIAALRSSDATAARRNLARLIPTLLVPAAALIREPITVPVGPGGTLGFTASGPRLRLGPAKADRLILFRSSGGTLCWGIDGARHGVAAAGSGGCEKVQLIAGTRATAFDGDDGRLPGMLRELGADRAGFATETVTPVSATPALRERIEDCFAALRTRWPSMEKEIQASVRLVVPMRSLRTAAFSNTAWQGAVFLRDDFADPLFLVERLVHEASHLRLNAVMVFAPLHEHDWDDRVASPFRVGLRPVTGLLHGALVFTRAAEAVLRVSRDGPLERRGAGRARALLGRVSEALATLRSSVRLTGDGERLVSEIDVACAVLTAECGDAQPDETLSPYLVDEI